VHDVCFKFALCLVHRVNGVLVSVVVAVIAIKRRNREVRCLICR